MDGRRVLATYIATLAWLLGVLATYILLGVLAYALGLTKSSALTVFAVLIAGFAATYVSVRVYRSIVRKR